MSISYQKFLELLREKENQRVDFKIRCDAFASPSLSSKAELLKDICTFSNNGNVTNYLIIGVSDDGTNFESVKNPNLKDETIQDYCRKNIFPPPLIHVFRKKWAYGKDDFKNVEFVIIQIGPHKRQAFRFLQDIINYTENVCFRKNEVWIRRGTISEIATPEEVSRLVSGKEPLESEVDMERRKERDGFLKFPQFEKCKVITDSIPLVLKKNRLRSLPERDCPKLSRFYGGSEIINSYIYETNSYLAFINFSECMDKLVKNDFLHKTPYIYQDFSLSENLAKKLAERFPHVSRLRRLHILPVLASVGRTRLQDYYQSWQWSGNSLFFFRPESDIIRYRSQMGLFQTSTEVLFIDKIKSISDFCERLNDDLQFFLSYDISQIFPKTTENTINQF